MALWFPIMVNRECIGRAEIQRTHTGDDGVHRYAWTVTTSTGLERTTGDLTHRYDDGALELIRKVLNAYAGIEDPVMFTTEAVS